MDSTVRVLFLGDSAGARRAAGQMESAFSKGFGNIAKSAAIAGTAIAGGIAAGLVAATNQAISFDKAMRNVNSIAGLSEKSFATLEKRVLALSKSTGQGPTVLAKGLYDIVSSGFKASQAIVIVRQAAIAATAGMTDTATASAAIVAALNAWHIPATKAKNVASDLFETVKQGVVSFPEVAQQMGDLTALAPKLGVSLQEVTGAFAALTLQGGPAAEHATRVKSVLTELLKPTKDMQVALKSLGYANAEAGIKTDGFQGLLQKLYVATGGNNETIAKLFPNVRALAGFLGLTGKNAGVAAKFLDRQNKAFKDGTEQTKAFNEQSKSISVQWMKAKAALEAAAVPLGQVMFPALVAVIGKASEFAGWLTKLDSKKTITAKLDFVWDSVKGIASHLWRDISDAITGDSTVNKIVVPGSVISFRKDGQGLASKFWQWTVTQIGTTPTAHVIVGGNIIEFKRDATLRDRFTKFVGDEAKQVNWSAVAKDLVIGIPHMLGTLSVAFGNVLADGVTAGIKHANFGDAKTAVVNVGRLLAAGMLQWARFMGAPLIVLWQRLGPELLSGAKSAAEFVWHGGIAGWLTAGAQLAANLITGVVKGLGKLAGNAASSIATWIPTIPGLVYDTIVSAGARIGGDLVSAIVSGMSGLAGAIASKIASSIPGFGGGNVKPSSSGGSRKTYTGGVAHNAAGSVISHPMLSVVGEDAPRYPEFIIPTNPKYAGRARGLLSGAANALGIPGFAAGAGTVGSAIFGTMPKVAHPKGSPNRKAKPIPGGGQITPPSGKEFNAIASAANAALAHVTQAALDVDNAGTLYDQTSRGYDLTRENFLLDVLDDPSDPTNTATHQERNEPDIAQRVNELTDLQGMKAHLIELMNAQEQAVNDAVSKLQGLIKKLLDDIDDLRVQIEAQVALAKAFRAEQTAHTQTANQYRADAASDKQKAENTRALIATETAKPKPNKAKLKAWHLEASRLGADAKDATEHAHGEDGAAKASGHKADAADKQIGRLQTMVKNRADSISNYRTAISDQQSSLLPGGIPNNIVNAQLDIIDLQNQASDVTGTKGTLAAVITPSTPAASTAATTTASADDAARLAALEAQLAQYRLALGIQTVQQSVLGGFVGSFAKGSLYIPDDGYALVHRGESINTRAQNAGRDSGGNGGPGGDSHVIVLNFADGMEWIKNFVTVTIDGATAQIATNVGISSDVRRRANQY